MSYEDKITIAQLKSRLALRETMHRESLEKVRILVWLQDIPSPTCPEYVEHHKSIQKILTLIDGELNKLGSLGADVIDPGIEEGEWAQALDPNR